MPVEVMEVPLVQTFENFSVFAAQVPLLDLDFFSLNL